MSEHLNTLADARKWLKGKLLNGGGRCPCCTLFAKVYRRQINAGMAMSLITMYRTFGLDFGYIPDLPAKSREEGKLVHWGLVVEAHEPRPDGGRAGWWRITEKGEAFIRRGLKVPKYVLIYDGRCLGYDDPDELIDIEDALTEKFNLDDLMGR
jgi:hypothetical protein